MEMGRGTPLFSCWVCPYSMSLNPEKRLMDHYPQLEISTVSSLWNNEEEEGARPSTWTEFG